MMLSVKQGGIELHFLSLWYDLIWNWTQVSQTIGEHSNHYVNWHTKDLKNGVWPSLFCIQHYKVMIYGNSSDPGKGVAPSPTPHCSSYWKGSLQVTLDDDQQTYVNLM